MVGMQWVKGDHVSIEGDYLHFITVSILAEHSSVVIVVSALTHFSPCIVGVGPTYLFYLHTCYLIRCVMLCN